MLNWMANNGKNGDKFKIRISARETTWTAVARIFATRMTVTKPMEDSKWSGKPLYIWQPNDCYHNLNLRMIQRAAQKAKFMNWQMMEEFTDAIDNLV